MPFTAQDLIEGRPQPVTTDSHATVTSALVLMIENDFSQLPVIDSERQPIGLITGDGILRGLSYFRTTLEQLSVQDVSESVRTYSLDDDIFDLLEGLRNQPAVVIVDAENCLRGIVTSYDTTLYFRRRAEDMMLVEDIENSLKDHINAAFTDARSGAVDESALQAAIDEVSNARNGKTVKEAISRYVRKEGGQIPNQTWIGEVCEELSKPGKKLEKLDLSHFIELLLHKSRWQDYKSNFSMSDQEIRTLLNDIRETRNALAHFRDEISSFQRDQLHFCANWLKKTPPALPEIGEDSETYKEPEIETLIPVEEEPSEGDSIYSRLATYLHNQFLKNKVSLTFDDIETVLDHRLPPSALQHRSWWANDSVSHVQSKQWLEAGWHVASVNMSEKRVTFVRSKEREREYIEFFSALLSQFQGRAEFPIKEVSPTGTNWLSVLGLPRAGKQQAVFSFAFAHQKRFRVELYIDTGDRDRTKAIFDILLAQRDAIEEDVGEELTWERLDEKRATRIALYTKGSITDDTESLADLREWAINAMNRLEQGIGSRAEAAISGEHLN